METKYEYGLDNIEDFYKEIDSKPNSKLTKLRIYYGFQHDQERIAKERDIADEMHWSGCTPSVTLVGDDMAVVTQTDKKYGTIYQPWVKDVKRNVSYQTFDEALLACISIKHTGSEDSTRYMYKLIKE